QIDIFHRDDLRIAAARRTALHSEARPKRWLAQTDHRLAADTVEAIAQADGGGRLALAGGGRIDGGDEDEPAVLFVGEPVDIIETDLRLGMAIGNEAVGRNAQFLADLDDRFHLGGTGDLDVALDGSHFGVILREGDWKRDNRRAERRKRWRLPTFSRGLRHVRRRHSTAAWL